MNSMENMAIAKLSESLVDAEAIAKSMVGSAVDRSLDLKVNPCITLLVMKAICQLAIKDYGTSFNKKHLHGEVAEKFDFMGEIEKMITSTVTAGYERHKRESKTKL